MIEKGRMKNYKHYISVAVIWLILAVVWGIVIVASLFKGTNDDDDIQEY